MKDRRARTVSRGLIGACLALACGGLLLAACGGEEEATFPGAPVVLITIDTLRSDHLPAYGHTTIQTPTLDAFRQEAILFERAYSHYPLTLPSHSSIFTGQLPAVHGVRDNVGYPLDAEAHPTLARRLKEAGYATGAAVSTYVLRGDTGIDDGFDFYEDDVEVRRNVPLGGLQRRGEETLNLALPWLDGVGEGPFFFFFHIYEPHSPYSPPEPYKSLYSDPYDGEVAYADSIIGRFFDELKRRGLYEDSLIVLLSDHGEGLGDHKELEHGIFLYRESLQVPLMVRLPGGKWGGETVSAPAELVDVAPTVLEALELPGSEGLAGMSLLRLRREPVDRPIYSETFFPRLHMGWSDLASLIQGGYQYIDAPKPELYHLEEDPGSRNNVLMQERRIFAEMRDDLTGFRAPLADPAAVDPETAAKLAALGYAGAPVAVDEGPLPDAKDQIWVIEDFKNASLMMAEKRWPEAAALLRRMVDANPRMQDAWEKLAMSLEHLGRRNEAVAAYRQALENGQSASMALPLSRLLLEMGRHEEARQHAELALASSPSLGHQRLAEIALDEKDLDTAERNAREAVENGEDRPGALILLTEILARQGKLEEAQEALAPVEERVETSKNRPPPGFHLVRGDLYARLGRGQAAQRELEEEIRQNPETLDAFTRLAVLYVTERRPDQAWRTLQRMVEENDQAPAAYVAAVETLRVLGDRATAMQLLAHARGLYPADPQLQSLAAG